MNPNKMGRAFLLVTFCCWFHTANATSVDTSAVLSLIDSAKACIQTNPGRAIKLMEDGLEHSRELRYDYGRGMCLKYLGIGHYYQGDINSALDYFNRADTIFVSLKDSTQLPRIYSNRGLIYSEMEEFDQALADYLKAIEINQASDNQPGLSANYGNLGGVYFKLEDYDRSWHYFQQGLTIDSILNDSVGIASKLGNMGGILMYRESYDKAREYFTRSLEISRSIGNLRGEAMGLSHLGVFFEKTGDYPKAREYYFQELKIANQLQARRMIASAYGNLAVTFFREENYEEALANMMNELEIYESLQDSVSLRNAYLKISECYRALEQFEEALTYMHHYDSLRKVLWEGEEERLLKGAEAAHVLVKREKELRILDQKAEIQELELSQKNLVLYGLSILIVLLLILFLVSIKLFRQRARTRQLALQQRLLRSRVNPHFIFNVFNSIQSYLINQDYQVGEKFLRKFALLIRKFLEKAEESFATVEEEVELMTLYLEVEQLRMGNSLDFEITVDPKMDARNLLMPAMIGQVYLENAVWHGVAPLDSSGKIEIEILQQKEQLVMIIKDNGIGINASRKMKEAMLDSHKSMGMTLVGHRLSQLNKGRRKNGYEVSVSDRSDDPSPQRGTRVELIFPIQH